MLPEWGRGLPRHTSGGVVLYSGLSTAFTTNELAGRPDFRLVPIPRAERLFFTCQCVSGWLMETNV